MNGHKTSDARLPVRMRPTTAKIDDRMMPLIEHLWRLGFTTLFCCQGDDDTGYVVTATSPRQPREALDTTMRNEYDRRAELRRQRAERRLRAQEKISPPGAVSQAYITFRSSVETWVFAAVAGPLSWGYKTYRESRDGRPSSVERWGWDWHIDTGHDAVRFPSRDMPRATAQLASLRWRLADVLARIGADTTVTSTAPIRAMRVCPACGGPVLSRRKDAKFCSRRCQLVARDRSGGGGRRGSARP
jgi:hypothetical protein